MTETLKHRFHKTMIDAFGEGLGSYDAETWLMQLGNERQIDDLFDELEFEFSGDIEEHQRARMQQVKDAMQWAHEAMAREAAEEAKEAEEERNKTPMPFAWRDELSGLQGAILKLSGLVGVVMFFVGVQLTVRGKKELGGTLTAGGMFLATQMFWGIKKCYNWLEKKHLGMLQKIGYRKLFWVFLIGTYTVEVVGLAAIVQFLGLDISNVSSLLP